MSLKPSNRTKDVERVTKKRPRKTKCCTHERCSLTTVYPVTELWIYCRKGGTAGSLKM